MANQHLRPFFDSRGLAIGDLLPPYKIESDEPEFDEFDDETDGLDPPLVNHDFGLDEQQLLQDIPTFPPEILEVQPLFQEPIPDLVQTPPAPEILNPAFDVPPPVPTEIEGVDILLSPRPQRVRKPPTRLVPSFKGKSYESTVATQIEGVHTQKVIHPNDQMDQQHALITYYCMTHLSMNAGLKRWKTKGESAVSDKLKQLHFRDTFEPLDPKTLSRQEQNQVLELHLFLKQK